MEKQLKEMTNQTFKIMLQKITTLTLTILILISCSKQQELHKPIEMKATDWKKEVQQTLKQFGHRNWIVVADGAYPEQSNSAIKTITVDADQLEVVSYVNEIIKKATHVDANIFIDKEMAFVSEEDAKGIESYRTNLNKLLEGKPSKTMLHEDIIRELDASAKLFNILIIKTDLAIPYTSVFFQLECGYWNAEAENKLRNLIENDTNKS